VHPRIQTVDNKEKDQDQLQRVAHADCDPNMKIHVVDDLLCGPAASRLYFVKGLKHS